jgi:predicted DNA-binding transcriptional regulator AlpA
MHIATTAPQSLVAHDPERLLRENEAAGFLGFSVRALQNWRVRGGGPVYVKVSARSVRYRRADLLAWTQARIRRSTSDIGPGGIR